MSESYLDGVRMWPLGQARMVSSLDADDAPAGEVSLWLDTSDPERPRAGIEVEIDLGALGTTPLHIPVSPRVIGGAARVILAPTYQAGERGCGCGDRGCGGHGEAARPRRLFAERGGDKPFGRGHRPAAHAEPGGSAVSARDVIAAVLRGELEWDWPADPPHAHSGEECIAKLVDAILAALDEDNLAVVKLPQPEPSPDGDGVMFHGRDSAMVIFVDDDGRIWDSDGEWTRGQSRANAAAFLAAARHAGAGERGE